MFKKILSVIITTSLIASPCYAGEAMSAGTVLSEDSYVFTLEEANKLKQRIEELEAKEEKLEEYVVLDQIHQDQILLYQKNYDIYQQQISEYKNISDIQNQQISRYERKDKWNRAENAAILVGGILLTTASFLVVDKVSDHMAYDPYATQTGLILSF